MHCSSTSTLPGVAAAEDAVQALMEYLVAPMLPFVSSGREIPSLALQESVAKQVHAVVLLYNYYYRKQHPQVEFLGFKSFCQLAVIVKPTLIGHMKLMHHADYAELDDVEKQLSMTEKAIMNACDISSALDPSKNTPSFEGREVSKVAVLLIDSSKENCLLQFSSTTQGVWSVIEKEFPCSGAKYEGGDGKVTNKRKRNSKKSQGDEVNIDEADLRQLALSAVTEATGISQGDLVVLESYSVYSLGREKSAVQFYIVQCTQSIDEELRLSIRNIIESLQGPLIRKRNSSWAVTPVVEYFHLLPYAGIMEEWFSREVSSNSLQVLTVGMEKVDVKGPQKVSNFTGSENRDDSKSKSNILASTDIHSGKANYCLEPKNDSRIRGVGKKTLDVKSRHKVTNSVGNETRDDSKRETNVIDSADTQSHKTENSKDLQKRDNTGTRGVGLEHVKDKYSEMTDKLSVDVYNKDEVEYGKIDINTQKIANGCSQAYAEVSMENNDNGNVTLCKSDSLGGSQNIGIGDSSMGYCFGAREIGDFDVKSCQKVVIDKLFDEEVGKDKLKCGKNTNATNSNPMSGIHAEASKQINNNGNDTSGLRDCHTNQKPIDADDSSKNDVVCTYLQKHNGKTNADSRKNEQSGIKVEFSEQITTDKIDSSGLPNCHTGQPNMDIDNSSIIQLQNGNKEGNGLSDCHTVQQPTDTGDSSKIDAVCTYRRKHNGKTNTESSENKQSGIKIESSKQITTDKIDSTGLPDCHTGQQIMDIDDSSMIQLQNGDKERNGCTITKVYRHKKRASSSNSTTNGKTGGVKKKVELDNSMSNTSVPKFKDEKTDKVNKTLSIMCSNQAGLVTGAQAIVPYQLNAEYQDNLQVTRNLNDNALSQTALTYLLRKKSKLALQLRDLEDEIAVCDKTIQTILDGGENELALQVEAVVDACYDISLKDEAETQIVTHVSPQLGRKRLSDAVIPARNSCHELDDICHNNYWTLPTYELYPVHGGFQASIKLKGTDFEYSEEGDLGVKPRLARESAAWKMIAKLQCVAGQSH